jgi:hypothetical protein
VSRIAAKNLHTVALLQDGTVREWGNLGNPVPANLPPSTLIAAGSYFSLSVLAGVDSDGDGVPDGSDNCPTIANPTQSDCDNDGIGDACEPGEDYNLNGTPDYCECIADLYVDGVVNGVDLGALLAYWGPATSSTASQRADLNRDGAIDGNDLGYLLSRWGPCTN